MNSQSRIATHYQLRSSVKLGQSYTLKLAVPIHLIRPGYQLDVPLSSPEPFWLEKGWQQGRVGRQHTGYYEANRRRWRGMINQPYTGRFDAYIWEPPITELSRNTAHRACFSPNGETGRYQVHFHTMPSSLDHALAQIEHVLKEATD